MYDTPKGQTHPIPGVNWNYKGYDAALGRSSRRLPAAARFPRSKPEVPDVGVHPEQVNLFSGRTAAEHEEFEMGTPDVLLGRHSEQDIADYRKDPMSDVRRRNSPVNVRMNQLLEGMKSGR